MSLPKLHRFCNKCLGMFINPECFRAHVVSGVCEKSTMCNECSDWFPNEVVPKHLCNGVACSHCGKPHNVKSGCFITTSKAVKNMALHIL